MAQPQRLKRIGAEIRKHRKGLGYSQESFAECIDRHRTYCGLVERGERNMTLASLLRICAGLRIKASELLRSVGE